ncbi:SLC13 family permease [Geobacter sulfurreducens]|uniref:SLC13 family permease n=1 Tax=Geobacter sulfurreducens TaxID=35554 RepID=UPI000DBB596E|nr:SLC13 family permease [Geobacter sulfurreducens]BBA70759.1 Sodium-dependent dicarboxylate transporter SdcS [Geobacter sulfurreducens]
MTIEILLVLGLVISAVILFATERIPVDIVALILMATLLLSGLITPEEAIGGFSNPATVTVGAMFILSAGLFRTGAVNLLGITLARLGAVSFWLVLVVMMLAVGVLSAFINNTAAVAIFLPIALGVARDTGVSASRLLMPLSFASMFGGVCTLIGTSTNILVSSIAGRHDLEPFGMFEMSGLGLIFFAAGSAYMLLVGVRLIPERKGEEDLRKLFGISDYLTEIVLEPEARSVGSVLADSPLLQDISIRNVEVFRDGNLLDEPIDRIVLQAGDHLKVRCDLENFRKLKERRGIALRQDSGRAPGEEAVLVEAVVAPGSTLDGRSLKQARFRSRYGLTALAVRHRGRLMREDLEMMQLRAGDVLLFEVEQHHLDHLREDKTFVLVSQVELPVFRKSRMVTAVAIVAAVVAAAATGLVPIVAGAIVGCILMVLTRCLTRDEAYSAINWQVIFLLAGVLTLGTALEKSGAARLLAGYLVETVGTWGPVALVSAFYLATSLLTEMMSNNATAAMLAPIAIASAEAYGVDSRPFLMAITFAASASFMTPVGYQTNTLIYGPGQFRYADFLRVGTPLNILFWVLATIFIPRFWPF